jgi:hypothetical protein
MIPGAVGTTDARDLFGAAVLWRFRGEAFLVGDIGRGVSSGANICEGSMPSVTLGFLVRAAVRGVCGISVVVLRRVDLLGLLRSGAGVKSSSSSLTVDCCAKSSSESSSTITCFRAAALRDGRVGDIEAMVDVLTALM